MPAGRSQTPGTRSRIMATTTWCRGSCRAPDEADQLDRGSAAIERLTGRRPRGYRSPGWDLSPNSVELLIDRGFVYDSSMMGHDYLPYRARTGDVIEAGRPVRFGAPTR